MANQKCTKRADGRYRRKVYLGRSEDGKKKYKYIYGATVKEVNRKTEEVLYALHKGTDVLSGDLPFSRWAERYLMLKEGKVAETYFAGIKGRAEWWSHKIGDLPLSKITRSQMQVALDELAANNPHRHNNPTSFKTLQDYKLTASAVFELAMADRAVTYNPAQYLEIKAYTEKEYSRALTEEEQRWILETEHRAQLPAMIMMLAGLRRGEVLALRVGDIDLDAGTIMVDKAVKFVKGRPVLKHGGKTEAATRTVYISETLSEYLRPIIASRSPFEPVVTDTRGRLMSESAFKRMWESYLKELNAIYGKLPQDIKSKYDPRIRQVIPKIQTKYLRHTFASNLAMANVDPIVAKAMIGHSDYRITANVYTHPDDNYETEQMSKMDKYLSKKYG